MEYLFIYLLQVAEIIPKIIEPTALVCGLLCIACFGISSFVLDRDFPKERLQIISLKKLMKILIYLLILCVFFCFFPTKQTLLLMGGTYLSKKAVNAVVTDEKIKKVDTIINLQLDKYIKELQKQNWNTMENYYGE